MHNLSMTTGLTLHGFITVLALLAYVVASHAFNQRRHPTAAIAWVLFILLVPYIALPAFLMFGSRKRNRPPLALAAPSERADLPWGVLTALALGQPAPAPYRELALHADGAEALAALWRVIDGASSSLDICTFIVGRDAIGDAVIARLAAKAQAGVRVRLLVDGMGQLMRRHPSLAPLSRAGAEVAVFVPPLRLPLRSRMNLRDHRKMVIADGGLEHGRLWMGGRNLACEYFEGRRGEPAWRDFTFDLAGAVIAQAAALFDDDWTYANRRERREPVLALETAEFPLEPSAQLIASGPDEVDDTVYTMLVTAAYRARTHIVIVTPYFVPDTALLTALGVATRRGVVVDLVIPAKSNHPMSDFARRRALRTLAASGGRIWLVAGMLHAKLVVIDDVLALAGSANVDSRSLFLNYELMMAFHEPLHVARFGAWAERERAGAVRYQPKPPGLVTDLAEGLVLWTGFQL